MSASASVVTAQAQGVNLPNRAVGGTGSLTTVNLVKNGKSVSTPVAVGLRGDSRTQIVSGLHAGQQVVVTDDAARARRGGRVVGRLGGGHAGRAAGRWRRPGHRRLGGGGSRRWGRPVLRRGMMARAPVIDLVDVHKTYALGEISVRALRGVTLSVAAPASTWRSWAARAAARRR